MTRPDEDLIEHILEASGHLAEIVEAGRADFNANWRSSEKPLATCQNF